MDVAEGEVGRSTSGNVKSATAGLRAGDVSARDIEPDEFNRPSDVKDTVRSFCVEHNRASHLGLDGHILVEAQHRVIAHGIR